MNRVYKVVATLTLSALFSTFSFSEEVKKPNILIVVLDDLGYADIGAYGSEIKTPNIDALAKNGLSYSNFHSTPTCSPTRASLLTARESHRVGMGLSYRV